MTTQCQLTRISTVLNNESHQVALVKAGPLCSIGGEVVLACAKAARSAKPVASQKASVEPQRVKKPCGTSTNELPTNLYKKRSLAELGAIRRLLQDG